MNLVDTWIESKKKTYWKIWESSNTDFTEGTYNWVLFFVEDEYDTSYHSGIAGSENECIDQMKQVVSAHLIHQNLL